MADFDNNVSAERKRQKKSTGNDDINKLVWEWFKNATSRRINLSGPLIKEKALKFAQDFGVESFKASYGWLESFKHRHNIVMGTMSGERGDVSNDTVNDWKSKLPTVCEGYTPQDIFNMDETGLYYRDTPKSTFKVNGEECTGGKRSKERLTIALCASMTGEKLPALVIEKCKKPRCFKNITPKALPVIYTSNKRAWMNSALFQWWLETFNRKMRRQSRNVLLFVDNAPSHPTAELSNVKLAFFPPNTTSKSQPMDQGIIQTMKLEYRKRQRQHIISTMEQDKRKCGTQLLKGIKREREMFYLTTHSTHFIYGYMASYIWLRTILIVRKETSCRHIGYSYGLAARVLLYAPSHRQDNTYHGLCYTSRGALAGTRNCSMGPPHEGSIRRPTAP